MDSRRRLVPALATGSLSPGAAAFLSAGWFALIAPVLFFMKRKRMKAARLRHSCFSG